MDSSIIAARVCKVVSYLMGLASRFDREVYPIDVFQLDDEPDPYPGIDTEYSKKLSDGEIQIQSDPFN